MNGSGDLLSHAPMHAGVWDGVDYDGGASCEMRQNPRCFSVCLWPQPVAVYILGPEAVLCRDHNPKPTRFLIRILSLPRHKNKTAKGSCAPARRRTGFRRTIHAHVACTRRLASPRLATPGKARRGERARVCGFPFLFSHTT